MDTRTGGCLCGAVRFEARLEGTDLGACHCGMCRRWSGAATVSLPVKADAMRIDGEDAVRAYRSSDWAERCFCGICGSSLWYRVTLPGGPHDYIISAGLMDDLSRLHLAHEIHIDRKPDAWAFAGAHARLTEAETLAQHGATTEGA